MCSEGYGTCFVCLCVCVSVCYHSSIRRERESRDLLWWALIRTYPGAMNHVSSQGFRLVVPYLDTCRVRVKAAWVGRKIEQVRSSPRAALTVIATLVHV